MDYQQRAYFPVRHHYSFENPVTSTSTTFICTPQHSRLWSFTTNYLKPSDPRYIKQNPWTSFASKSSHTTIHAHHPQHRGIACTLQNGMPSSSTPPLLTAPTAHLMDSIYMLHIPPPARSLYWNTRTPGENKHNGHAQNSSKRNGSVKNNTPNATGLFRTNS